MAVGAPIHGQLITHTSPNYSELNDTLRVAGRATNVPIPANGWEVIVQGSRAGFAQALNGDLEFSSVISLAPGQGGSVPYSSWLDDTNRPLIGVLAELVDPSGRVVARDRMVLYDGRGDDRVQPGTPSTKAIAGLGAQLTAEGLDALEPVHESNLFYPSSTDFHGDLDEVIAGRPTADFATGEVCFDLTEGHPLTDSEAYDLVQLEAWAVYAVYEGLGQNAQFCALATEPTTVAICTLLAGAVRETLCVKSPPLSATRYEVCVETLEIEPTDLTVGSVSLDDLAFGAGGTLLSTPILDDLDGTFTARLDDVTIRSKNSFCTARPKQTLTTEDYEIAAVSEWRTCDDLEIDADTASPIGSMTYALDVLEEEVDVGYLSGSFLVPPTDTYGLGLGTCSEDWVAPMTELALVGQTAELGTLLTEAWSLDAPYTAEAEALDLLLAPYDVGVREPRLYDPLVTWTLQTDPTDGMWLRGTTTATPVPRSEFSWFYYEADPGPEWLLGGLDQELEAFDVGFAVTTGYLNQVIGAGYATGLLEGKPLRPTRRDLGATGANAGAPVKLDGNILAARVDPVFAEIGNRRVTLVVDGTLTPFTLMERDPPVDPGDYLVSYNAPALHVALVSGNDVWARFAVDMHASDLAVSWDQGSHMMSLSTHQPLMTWTALEWNFVGCDPRPRSLPLPTCETDAVAALAQVANPSIRRLLQALIDEVPAPKLFDAEGTASARLDVSPNVTGTWNADQVIHVLGVLD